MTINGHPRIAFDPAIRGGRATVAGTRMRVSDVLEMLAGGANEAEIVADFPYLGIDDIRACLAYAAGATEAAPLFQRGSSQARPPRIEPRTSA